MYTYIGKETKHSRHIPVFPLRRNDYKSSLYSKNYTNEICDNYNWINKNDKNAIIDNTIIEEDTQNTDMYSDMVINGSTFNAIYRDIHLVKLTNESGTHRYFQYTEGLNIDYKKFGATTKYGLYFCDINTICEWNKYYSDPLKYIWDVSIPSDARVVICNNKFKTDKFNLSNKRPITQHIYLKIINMISNPNIIISSIIEYITVLPEEYIPKTHMDDIWKALININPEVIKDIPTEYRTYNVCLYAAQNYDDAYDYIIDFCEGSYSIVMECLTRNPSIYVKLDKTYKTKKASILVYNYDNNMYEYIPDTYKTIEMSIKYLQNSNNNSFNVPVEHINNIELINKVIPYNGMFLNSVPYKLKTIKMCIEALNNNGKAINSVPLNMLDYNMCYIAVENSAEAYNYVPEMYRTVELKELYVDKYMYVINNIEPEYVTHNMILSILKDNFLSGYVSDIDYDNHHIRCLFISNFKEYVDINNEIINYLPFNLMYEDWSNMYYAVQINNNIFTDNHEKFDFEFSVEIVKSGINFYYLPQHKVTLEILDELVTTRMNIINEIPTHFVHDGLYKICMEIHGMKLEDVPEEYRTEVILKVAQKLYPEENNFTSFLNKDDNNIEMGDMSNMSNMSNMSIMSINVYDCDNLRLIDKVI